IPLDEYQASEELAQGMGKKYIPSPLSSSASEGQLDYRYAHPAEPSMPSANASKPASNTAADPHPRPRPRPRTAKSADRINGRTAAEASQCRNSLFPSVVKQQSRCLSVLLQQGPHGGIRRVGPLLISGERGGKAIELLNPAFIDMMDVQPVDNETIAMLRKSNLRRRSFSMAPNSQNSDWFSNLASLMAASGASAEAGAEEYSSATGPGMWWPLNDDNCSDEVAHDVQMSIDDHADASPPMPCKNPAPAGQPGYPVASAAASASGNPNMFIKPASAQNSTSGCPPPLSLQHTVSDMSDCSSTLGSATKQQQSVPSTPTSTGFQLSDVSMRTESGMVTRSVKSMSLRLLVNRLASPEGNVDSELMTDFLNSYRFFAHPIDFMRLIIVRYLNCFSTDFPSDDTDASDADEADQDGAESDGDHLTINGWRNNSDHASPGGRPASSASRRLPSLANNESAIIQLRVMNIIKYWIKFHPHDFRLHHRLTRLLLLFLSHIQKQPGRADFVNSIRQKLSSGKLLAVETPSFMISLSAPPTTPATAVPSQAPSVRNSEIRMRPLDCTRSALDLQSLGASNGDSIALHPLSRAESSQLAGNGSFRKQSSMVNMGNEQHLPPMPRLPASNANPAVTQPSSTSAGKPRQTKKSSPSYFMSLFSSRSHKNSANTQDSSSRNTGGAVNAYNADSI
ncbi:hypothetical protein GGI12_005492, partial [Dipsacomyces acuminosporus]